MKKTEKHLGTGITRRKVETSVPETLEDRAQLGYSGIHPFEDFLNGLESDCATELRKLGLPCEPGAYFKRDGKWVKADAGRYCVDVEYVKQTTAVRERLNDEDYDSVAGYSARFLDLITSLRGRLKRGETDADALHQAYELGKLLSEAKFKRKFEKWTTYGLHANAFQKKGGRTKAAEKAPDIKARNAKMLRELESKRTGDPHHDAGLKRAIGDKFGLKRSQAYKVFKQH